MHSNFCKLHGKGKMFVVLNGMCIQKSIYYKYFGDITNARNDSANALYKKGVHDDQGYLIRVFDANTLEFIFVLMKQAMSPSGSSFDSVFFFYVGTKGGFAK